MIPILHEEPEAVTCLESQEGRTRTQTQGCRTPKPCSEPLHILAYCPASSVNTFGHSVRTEKRKPDIELSKTFY